MCRCVKCNVWCQFRVTYRRCFTIVGLRCVLCSLNISALINVLEVGASISSLEIISD